MSFRKFKREIEQKKKDAETQKKEKEVLEAFDRMLNECSVRYKEYVEDAKRAMKAGDQTAYSCAVSLIKNIIFQKAQAADMKANYQMARDLRDMGMLRKEGVKAIASAMKDVEKVSGKIDTKLLEKNFLRGAFASGEVGEELQKVLSSNGMAFSDQLERVSKMDDADIRRIIEGEIIRDTEEMDRRLASLEEKLNAELLQKENTEVKTEVKTEIKDAAKVEPPKVKIADAEPKREETPKPQPEKSKKPEPAPVPESVKPTASAVGAPKAGKADSAPSAKKAEPEKPKAAKDEETTPEDAVLSGKAEQQYVFQWNDIPTVSFDDIAGLETVKEEVRMNVLLPMRRPDLYEGYDGKKTAGLLLFGPPGTGKTMVAAAIAKEVNAKFCAVSPSQILQQGFGSSEKMMKALFDEARSFPCAVIYFDEFESIAPKSTASQYTKNLRSEFLTQLQGAESYGEKNDNVLLLIASTNKPWDIDSAFLRPGRFGTRIYVGLPDAPARRYMIEKFFNKIEAMGQVTLDEGLDIDDIVEKTQGFNGADITALLSNVQHLSIARAEQTDEKIILPEDFEQAYAQTPSSVQSEDIEKLLEWKNKHMKS